MKTLLTLIISLCCFNRVQAQTLDETFSLGKALYEAGAEKEADLLFQRVIFFGYGQYDAECFNMLGEIAWKAENYQQAAQYFNGAIAANQEASERNRLLLRRANALMLAGELALALQDLLSTNENLPNSLMKNKQFMLGTIYFVQKEFEQSALALKQCFNKPEDQRMVETWINTAANIKHPNPRKAKRLSKYLPGLGQFYAGDIKNGINSMLLASFFVYTTINTAITYTYIEAALTIAPWLQRYYQGGFTRAEIIAQNKLDRKQFKYYEKVVALLEAEQN